MPSMQVKVGQNLESLFYAKIHSKVEWDFQQSESNRSSDSLPELLSFQYKGSLCASTATQQEYSV